MELEGSKTIILPAVKLFVAEEHICDSNPDGIVFDHATADFIGDFLCPSKREHDVPEVQIVSSQSPTSIDLLPDHPTALAHFCELLKRQADCQPGDLEIDGSYNIFAIKNNSKKTRLVFAKVHGWNGWILGSLASLGPTDRQTSKFFWTSKALSE